MDYDQGDPNQREAAPFENPNGPPNYPVHPQQNQQYQPGPPPQEAMQTRFQGGNFRVASPNGNGRPLPSPQSTLLPKLRTIQMASQVGAFELAQVWAQQLQMFRIEYQQQTGQALSEAQALDLVTAPMFLALQD